MAKSKLKLLLFILLFISYFDGQFTSPEEETENGLQSAHSEVAKESKHEETSHEEDANLKAAHDDEEAEDASAKGTTHHSKKKAGKESEVNKIATRIKDELKDKFEKVKNKKTKPLDGNSGKIMKIIIEAIKDINPIRLIQAVDPDPLLAVKGVDIEKLKLPAHYFAESFFDKMSKKTNIEKAELSKEVGANVETRKEGDWVSIGGMLKVGKKKGLKLGDYLDFLGLALDSYEKKYEEFLIEAIRVPVEFIDDVLNDGFTKFIQKFKDYVTTNGGPMNAALKAYGDYTGVDVVNKTKHTINKLKNISIGAENIGMNKGFDDYKKQSEKLFKEYYKNTFGKNGTMVHVRDKLAKQVNSFMKFVGSIYSGNQLKAGMDLIGHTLGPTGRAIVYIVYQPTATMLNQVFGPLLLFPRIWSTDEDIWDKVLSFPPIIIQTSGGLFKPIMLVGEPFLRLVRFLSTGEYSRSLNCGLEVAAAYGISIYGGGYKPKKIVYHQIKPASGKKAADEDTEPESKPTQPGKAKPIAKSNAKPAKKKRTKRQTKKGKSKPTANSKHVSKPGPASGADDDANSADSAPAAEAKHHMPNSDDQKLAESYQGGPPPGGHKLGVKNDGKIDLDDEDFIARILLSPDFILKAGGPVFVPFASVLAPVFRAFNTILFGKADFPNRMSQVPEMIRGVGLVGPLADVIQEMLPFIKTFYLMQQGTLKTSELILQVPSLVKHATSGVLYELYKHPEQLIKAMMSWFKGTGGLISMLKMQASGEAPKSAPGAATRATEALRPHSDFVVRVIGDFFGGWFLSYLQAMGPVGSMMGAFFNGVIGEVLDPVKFLDTNINLKHQPLKNLIIAFDDLPRMLKSAMDKRKFLAALLGGQDPDVLNEIGINVEKLAENGIDPALLLAGGRKMLPLEVQTKLDKELSSLGIDGKLLAKVDLNVKTFLETGLLDANHQKLQDSGIELNLIENKIMRSAVEDESKLANAGINIREMLRAGVNPAHFLAGGIGAVPHDKLKELGIVNKKQLSPENLKRLGINPTKLHSRGIDVKILTEEGIDSYTKVQANIGINIKVLMTSMYTGLDPTALLKAGVDLKQMVSAGIDTKLLLVGGIKKALKNDLSHNSLARVGIDLKQVLAMGININLLTDVGASVLNPMNLVKMGICPMRTIIGTLSRTGLDTLTGGLDDATSVSFGFVSSLLKILQNMYGWVPHIRDIPYLGPMIMDKNGKFTGMTGFFFYKILGIENSGGLLKFMTKVFNGKFTMQEMLILLSPIRIADETANPNAKPKQRRRKENRKPIDEYVEKSMSLRVGDSHTPGKKPKPYSLFEGRSTQAPEAADTQTQGDEAKAVPPNKAPKGNPMNKISGGIKGGLGGIGLG